MNRDETLATDQVGASPTRIESTRLRFEAARALVWASVIGLVVLSIYVSQSLLVIFGALVFAAMIDGGARLLGRVLKIGRGWRVALVLLSALAFLGWLVVFAGTEIRREATEFPELVTQQIGQLLALLREQGFSISTSDVQSIAGDLFSGIGSVTQAIGGVFGGLTTLLLIVIIGIYLAADPRVYERGVAWMLPEEHRPAFFDTLSHQAYTMRRLLAGRLLGMVIEGVFTWAMLAIYGVPMAVLLGLITGLLVFIPNVGAVISGALMILVGFSGGTEMGLYTIFVYLLVQNFDGYVIIPMIAKKTVDLAPALVLSAQLVFGVLFGILGLALADPLLAMIKVGLERRAVRIDHHDVAEAESA